MDFYSRLDPFLDSFFEMVNLKPFGFISKMVQVALIDGARMFSILHAFNAWLM